MSIFHILNDKNFDNYINDIIINDNDVNSTCSVNSDADNDDKNFEDYINNVINGNDSRSRLSSRSSNSNNDSSDRNSNSNNNDNNNNDGDDVISMCVIDYTGLVIECSSLYESIIGDNPTNNFNIFDHLDYSKTSYEKILEIILSIENHTNTIIHMITYDKIPYLMEIFMILDDKVYLQISEKSLDNIRKTRQNVSDKENGGLLGVLNQEV